MEHYSDNENPTLNDTRSRMRCLRLQVGNEILLKNLKRNDRNGWSLMAWPGPFVIENMNENNTSGDSVMNGEIEDIAVSTPNDGDNNTNTRLYKPVSEYWMMEQCLSLKIDLSSIKQIVEKCSKPLTTPTKTINVLGDGNCWYRCVSVWINGSEENHELIRMRLHEFLITDDRMAVYVGDLEAYLDFNPLHEVGTWATDVEIFATALMLNTSIYIYSEYYNSWQLFSKNGIHEDEVKTNENYLYMSHVNRNHYTVVIDVD